MSVSASPEMTRNGPSRSASSAFLTLPAVPERHVLGGVLQAHADVLAVAEVVPHHRGEELHGDHRLGETVPLAAAAARAP